jgi:hypothetical protein
MNLKSEKSRIIRIQKSSVFRRILRQIGANREPGVVDINTNEETQELIYLLNGARKDLISACQNYEYVEDQLIIDYYIYKIKACQVRYEYYIKKAKEKGIKVDLLETSGVSTYSNGINV